MPDKPQWADGFLPPKRIGLQLIIGAVAGVIAACSFARTSHALAWLALLPVALTVGLLLRYVLTDFVAGAILQREKPVGFGDAVAVGKTSGRIVRIGRIRTALLTRNGITRVRNSALVESTVDEIRRGSEGRSLKLTLAVRSLTGPDTVREILLGAIARSAFVLKHPAPAIHFDGPGSDALNFTVLVRLVRSEQAISIAGSELASAIGRNLAHAGIDAVVHFTSRAAVPAAVVP